MKGVDFYYVYKSLAHPGLDGYVAPATLEERLAHLAEAKEQLGTRIPWIADSMDNGLKRAFGDRPNSEFVVSPEGVVVVARAWSDPAALRSDLERLVGPSETVTRAEDIGLPSWSERAGPGKVARGVVPPVARPGGSQPILVEASAREGGEPLYLKLRAEADPALLREGRGALHLSFALDPIHRVHWNNLAPPLEFRVVPAEGAVASVEKAAAAKVEEAEADLDPREFLLEIDASAFDGGRTERAALRIEVAYYACDDEGRWCRSATQEFALRLERDRDGGSVRGRRAGSRRPARPERGAGRPGMRDPAAMIERHDRDGDGAISREEAPAPMVERFEEIDRDGDGRITLEELRDYLR